MKFSIVLLSCLAMISTVFSAQISEKANFIYFAVPKVGTNTIHTIFKSSELNPFVEMTHLPLSKYDRNRHRKYFKFAFVRNPWSRVVSCYFNKVISRSYPPFRNCFGMSFTEFVHYLKTRNLKTGDCHIRHQTQFFPLEDLDFVGRIEDFPEDFYLVLRKLGLDMVDLPRKNSTEHAHYSTYYTPETRAIVEQLYREDIVTFGYVFETE